VRIDFAISFAISKPTPVTVEILDEKGKVVRHLAAGLLGEHAPEPFLKGRLAQSLLWDRKDDDGRRVWGKCQVRVGPGAEAQVRRGPRRREGPGAGAEVGWPAPGQHPGARQRPGRYDMRAGWLVAPAH